MTENEISNIVINCAIEVHKTLGGPGLLESVYEQCLAIELENQKINIKRQKELPIVYKNKKIGTSLRIDLLVENKVIIECKAVEKFNPIYKAQALTYLRLSGLKLALVLNFGEKYLKNGIYRVVNGL
ncbi:MAG: GxxExxY protein [Spirochaetia bacterium]|nr:GxxExxY protein [Spirochaetia bacterium]